MDDAAPLQFDLTPPTDEQRRTLEADLSDEERHVLLEHGTEAPFCGVFFDVKRPGVYTCRLCGLPLFHGMSQTGPNKWSGTIYNADDGNTYASNVSVGGPGALRVEGCVGALCSGEVWTRSRR